MNDFIRITIKSSSGYCPVDKAYEDKVTITASSIQYEYKPVMESDNNVPRKWSYKTSSPKFQELFKAVSEAVEEILDRGEEPFIMDIGVTSFAVTYGDKTRRHREFFLPGDDFKECFAITRKMVPSIEEVPLVLLTSEDYKDW